LGPVFSLVSDHPSGIIRWIIGPKKGGGVWSRVMGGKGIQKKKYTRAENTPSWSNLEKRHPMMPNIDSDGVNECSEKSQPQNSLSEEVPEQSRKRKKEYTIEDYDRDANDGYIRISLSQYAKVCKEITETEKKSFDEKEGHYETIIKHNDKMLGLRTIQLHSMRESIASYSSKFHKTMACSICMETIACAHNLVPCGHVFCYICIAQWIKTGKNKACPLCQTPYNTHIPYVQNKLQDNLMLEHLKNPVCTLENKSMDYERRLKGGIESKRKDETKEYVPGFEQEMNRIFGNNFDNVNEN
jgi:hypothetical protein